MVASDELTTKRTQRRNDLNQLPNAARCSTERRGRDARRRARAPCKRWARGDVAAQRFAIMTFLNLAPLFSYASLRVDPPPAERRPNCFCFGNCAPTGSAEGEGRTLLSANAFGNRLVGPFALSIHSTAAFEPPPAVRPGRCTISFVLSLSLALRRTSNKTFWRKLRSPKASRVRSPQRSISLPFITLAVPSYPGL